MQALDLDSCYWVKISAIKQTCIYTLARSKRGICSSLDFSWKLVDRVTAISVLLVIATSPNAVSHDALRDSQSGNS